MSITIAEIGMFLWKENTFVNDVYYFSFNVWYLFVQNPWEEGRWRIVSNRYDSLLSFLSQNNLRYHTIDIR